MPGLSSWCMFVLHVCVGLSSWRMYPTNTNPQTPCPSLVATIHRHRGCTVSLTSLPTTHWVFCQAAELDGGSSY